MFKYQNCYPNGLCDDDLIYFYLWYGADPQGSRMPFGGFSRDGKYNNIITKKKSRSMVIFTWQG